MLDLLNRLAPKELKNNPANLMRSYVLIGLLITNATSISIVILLLLTIMPLSPGLQWIALSISIGLLFAYSSILLFFIYTGKYKASSHFVIITLSSAIYLAMQITGGYESSCMRQLILLIPVSAFLLLGLKSGSLWAVITFLITCCLWALGFLDKGYIQLFSESQNNTMDAQLHFLLFFMIAGAIIVYELINEDLKSKLNSERNKLAYEASHDALTSIPNRLEFYRRLNKALVEAEDRDQKLAVVYIDLDGFKPINDTYGHHVGDILLKAVAQRLQKNVRRSDTTARLGGDEFALLLPSVDIDSIHRITASILHDIKEPINIDNSECIVRASMGVALFPNDSALADELCVKADTAMYKAKELHDCCVFYSDIK